MRVSVVIPSWNDLSQLRRCLESLRGQELPSDRYQLVVVDDGSTDGTADWLQQQRDVTAVILPENRGRSAARNAGLASANGDQIVFLDADLSVPPDFLNRHLEQGAEDTILLGRVRFAGDSGRKGFQRYMETRGAWKHRDGTLLPPRYFVTCNAMVPAALLEQTGGFDEQLRYWGGEDMDLGLRLGQAGARFRFNEQAIAFHHQQRSFSRHLQNLTVFGEQNLPRLLEKHPLLVQELQLDRIAPGGTVLLRLIYRSRMSCILLQLLRWLEKGLRRRRLPDRLYDLAIYLAMVRGLRKANRWHS